jgi:hypothetical protein
MSATITRKNPNALREVIERIGRAAQKEIAVGFPKGKAQAYPDGTSVIDVAAWNVYGTKSIPERNFMSLARRGIVKNCDPLLKDLAKLQEGRGAEALRNAIGEAGKSAIQDAITELNDPPNSTKPLGEWLAGILSEKLGRKITADMSYVDVKGSDNPLIWTGHLLSSVDYDVRDRSAT